MGVRLDARCSAARQFLAGGEKQRVVVEARVPPGAPRSLLLVGDEEVLLTYAHRRCRGFAAVRLQADGVFVEGDRAVEIRDRQVHGAQA
jgi:hypothetical protein